jgi:signal transduction histidine kinase
LRTQGTELPYQRGFERILPWFVLAILLSYTYARFFQVPYTGFDFNPSDGQVVDVFIQPVGAGPLRTGDHLLQVGSLSWESFRQDARQPWLDGAAAGQTIQLTVRRDGQEIPIAWVLPGANLPEVIARLINLWFLAYVFWLAGTASLVFLRPKDTRWKLFITFNYLTAIWLTVGTISRWQVWYSAILTRSLVWLFLPVFWHLHWHFPRPLGRLQPAAPWALYLVGAALSVLDWMQVLPKDLYFLGFFLAILGGVVLLIAHYVRQPLQRRAVGLIATSIALSILPSLALSIAGLVNNRPFFSGGALIALPIIPAVYFYVVFRRQLGGLELRANRIISIYLFSVLTGSIFLFLSAIASAWKDDPGTASSITFAIAIFAAVTAAVGYPRFKQSVERHLLGIPLPPENLVEAYTNRIVTSLDLPALLRILRDEVLPSLLIRQSALLQVDENGHMQPLLLVGVSHESLPDETAIVQAIHGAGGNPPNAAPIVVSPGDDWVRVILPLTINYRRLGYWLLGSRSPDDFYPQSELPFLNTLANQTAIALTNISQSKQLHSLYQTDIQRYEKERTKMARDLHDDVLNRVIILGMYVDLNAAEPRFQTAYHELVEHIRQTISGLRPPMLDYGLQVAIEDMIDEMVERLVDHIQVSCDLPPSEMRYDPSLEQHLYRIVQQACENAFRHSRARVIRVAGKLEPDRIVLTIEDNGIGFETNGRLDLSDLLMNGHFGLVGMFERARLIGAEVDIQSVQHKGTVVSILWEKPM